MINIAIISLAFVYISSIIDIDNAVIRLLWYFLGIGVLLNIRYIYENEYGKDNYLFRKEMKPSYFMFLISAATFLIYIALSKIMDVSASLNSNMSYLVLGMDVAFLVVVSWFVIYVFFKDILNITLQRSTYSFSSQETSYEDMHTLEESREDKEIEVIKEKSEEEEVKHEGIKKVPVIVITKE